MEEIKKNGHLHIVSITKCPNYDRREYLLTAQLGSFIGKYFISGQLLVYDGDMICTTNSTIPKPEEFREVVSGFEPFDLSAKLRRKEMLAALEKEVCGIQ